jgi:hypothetical protein
MKKTIKTEEVKVIEKLYTVVDFVNLKNLHNTDRFYLKKKYKDITFTIKKWQETLNKEGIL